MEVKAQLPKIRFGAVKIKEEMVQKKEGKTDRQSACCSFQNNNLVSSSLFCHV